MQYWHYALMSGLETRLALHDAVEYNYVMLPY